MFRIVDWYRSPRTWQIVIGPLLTLYALLTFLDGGFRVDHGLIISIMLLGCYVDRFRTFLQLTFPMFMVGLLYDMMRHVTPFFHSINPPRVEELYRLEQFFFGIETDDGRLITPPEYFIGRYSVALDLPCAFAYCFYMYESFLLAFYLFAKDHITMRRFVWAFFVTNILGMVTYYVYPAAPPWYVVEHGLGPAMLDAPANAARLAVVDTYLGITYFEGFYSRSSNVFGAMPSLHAAYPMIAWVATRRVFPRAHWVFLAFALLTGFAAVYLQHHYILDVLLGAFYAWIAHMGITSICARLEERDRQQLTPLGS
ncbi:MAG: phosphatase PAP2 family protein [Myxococcota bacterium]|nr:phosphatase PAP2 family protein [Myxococcota bacterium]